MSRTKAQRARRLRVRSVRREEPDLKKLGRALIAIALAQAQAEADAEAAHRKTSGDEGTSRAA